MITTKNIGLHIPEQDDIYDIGYVAYNMQHIDAMFAGEDSITTISDNDRVITTQYKDGNYQVTTISGDNRVITTETFNKENILTGKSITEITGKTITSKEVSV